MYRQHNLKRIVFCLLLCLSLGFLACGCGSSADEESGLQSVISLPVKFEAGKVEPDVTELTIVLEPGETEQLSELTELTKADLSGSTCLDEILAWAQVHPEVDVTYTVTMPDGSVLPNDTDTLDLSSFSDAGITEVLGQLPYLPGIKTIELGAERSGLGWESIEALETLCPNARINYVFDLYGHETELRNTQINLSHVPVEDGGAAVNEAMYYMPDLCYLDMDSCGVSDEEMAAIRDAHPDVKVVWRVWFGDSYSVRTDVERILASMPTKGGMLTPENTQSLKYCTEVRLLDIGHNDDLTDISFVAYMPKLEVAILAMDFWSDASPLANCTELEYLEIQTTSVTDLSPLAGLTKLHHLNIAHNRDISDISPLYGLTELERLWIGCMSQVPSEQVQAMQEAVPGCEINLSVYEDPVGGRWRYVDYNELAYLYIYHPRYIELREQFGDYELSAYSFYWNDPLL